MQEIAHQSKISSRVMGSKGNFDAYSELDERNFANREFKKK